LSCGRRAKEKCRSCHQQNHPPQRLFKLVHQYLPVKGFWFESVDYYQRSPHQMGVKQKILLGKL
jgi:hypothetical protein